MEVSAPATGNEVPVILSALYPDDPAWADATATLHGMADPAGEVESK